MNTLYRFSVGLLHLSEIIEFRVEGLKLRD